MRHQQKNSEFYLAPSEINKLIDGAEGIRNRVIISLFAYTGIRRAELRDLFYDDIEIELNRIIIRNGKGGKQRIVFIPKALENLLYKYLKLVKTGPLFPGYSGNPLSLRSINNIVASTGHSAGVKNPNPRYKNINPHLLRHSLARNWKDAGGSLESLQKILGHESMKTTMDLYGTQSLNETEIIYRNLSHSLVR